MTDNQKSRIDTMRREGYGYVKIAQTISVSENTVKPIDNSKRRSKRFCSDSCRMK